MYKNRVRIYKSLKGKKEIEGQRYCIYWMQQAQRTHYNHALTYAVELANRFELELVVFFGISPSYPQANLRHYSFMMEGIKEVIKELDKLNIGWCVGNGSPEESITGLLPFARVLVMDKGYTKVQREWRKQVVKKADDHNIQGVYEIETDLIVPVETTSQKEEYAARTIRPKIMSRLKEYLVDFEEKVLDRPVSEKTQNHLSQLFPLFKGEDIVDINSYLNSLPINKEVEVSPVYKGGYSHAIKALSRFMEYGLYHYDESNIPGKDYTSKMSLYLHFGQISPIEIIVRIQDYVAVNPVSQKAIDSYMEQLCVRRELAYNFCYYREGYDTFHKMTYTWAYETMKSHELDYRPTVYTLDQLESYNTHDSYWNAAMKEMVVTGYMHNYMRMYWCKKIIEWSPSHEKAYEWSVYLNNKYFIDGRNPNSYVGIAWCFGLHDHGWKEREIFGKLRYMNDKGLKRKFDMQAYIDRVNDLITPH